MPAKQLGELIRAARLKAGYRSLYAFGKATGVSAGQLSQIERGLRSPSIVTLERIMGLIGWEVVVSFHPRPKRRRA